MKRKFPVILEKDPDHGYCVYCPVIQGCVSQGDTFEEALENIKEAIELCLEVMLDEGEEMPGNVSYAVSLVDVDLPLEVKLRKAKEGTEKYGSVTEALLRSRKEEDDSL